MGWFCWVKRDLVWHGPYGLAVPLQRQTIQRDVLNDYNSPWDVTVYNVLWSNQLYHTMLNCIIRRGSVTIEMYRKKRLWWNIRTLEKLDWMRAEIVYLQGLVAPNSLLKVEMGVLTDCWALQVSIKKIKIQPTTSMKALLKKNRWTDGYSLPKALSPCFAVDNLWIESNRSTGYTGCGLYCRQLHWVSAW